MLVCERKRKKKREKEERKREEKEKMRNMLHFTLHGELTKMYKRTTKYG